MYRLLSKGLKKGRYSPVDDAMPERLPQARLTMIVESLGLKTTTEELIIHSSN
jgi:hypothetical protein